MDSIVSQLISRSVYPVQTYINDFMFLTNINNFYSTEELLEIKNELLYYIDVNKLGQGGVGSVYQIQNYILKITDICPLELGSNPLHDQLCIMSLTGDEIYLIPNTEYRKTNLICPNYIVEPIIGSLLNTLRQYTPSFMQVYGCIYDKQVRKTYQILEPLDNIKTIKNFDKSVVFFFFQIFFALNVAQKTFRYTHWDLHIGNVMVRKREATIQKYKIKDNLYLYSKLPYDAVIIDYGHNRCETTETIVTPKIHFVNNSVNREVLDYYDFNPFYDIFSILFTFWMYHESSNDVLTMIMLFFKQKNHDDAKNMISNVLPHFTDKIVWRAFPEKLCIGDTPLTAIELCEKISYHYLRSDIMDLTSLDNYLSNSDEKFVVLTYDIETYGEYYRHDNSTLVQNTSYIPYISIPPILGELGKNPYEIKTYYIQDLRNFKNINLTKNSEKYKNQYITVASMMQPSTINNVFSFRADCCRIDLRTFFQNPIIYNGVAINTSFFNIGKDYVPIGYYKHNNTFFDKYAIPELYQNYYRSIVIDKKGDLNIISLEAAIANKDYYSDIFTAGPILIENGKIIMTNEVLQTKYITDTGKTIYPFLCDRPPENFKGKILPNGVMNCNEIKPGELSHSGNPNPRSALGIDINNIVYFLTVTGRDDMGTTGYDLDDLARLCSEFKIHTAINLDGGRSSLITEKSDGYIRVSNINSANAYPVGNILSYINY